MCIHEQLGVVVVRINGDPQGVHADDEQGEALEHGMPLLQEESCVSSPNAYTYTYTYTHTYMYIYILEVGGCYRP